MNSNDIAAQLKPEIIESFKRAIEIGKWSDGNTLTDEQREVCMQAVITYEYHNLPEDQRTGYVPPKETACATKHEEVSQIKWQHDTNGKENQQ